MQYFPAIGSDHSPIMINTDYHDKRRIRRFKFEILWAEIEGCLEMIKQGWDYKGEALTCIDWFRS